MNLTRMRSFGWVDYVTPIMLKWKLYIPWGDQVYNITLWLRLNNTKNSIWPSGYHAICECEEFECH